MNTAASALVLGLLLGAGGCANECDDRPPPCLDESLYSFTPPPDPEHPVGAAVVEYNGLGPPRAPYGAPVSNRR